MQVLADAPAWVHPQGKTAPDAWWPCGDLYYVKRDGTPVDGVLVIDVAPTEMRLRVVPPGTMVRQARPDWPAAPNMGGQLHDQLQIYLELAAAICSGAQVVIGYQKAKAGGDLPKRRLERVVPHPNGLSLIAHDLDRDAPRTFRLDRIAWVQRSPVDRLLIVGCGKSKAAGPCPAAELYTGPLFRAARAHAEASGHPWLILSAEHGLLDPTQVVATYDHQLRAGEVRALGALVAAQAAQRGLQTPDSTLQIELHAGNLYAKALEAAHLVHKSPLAGLQVGERLAWYKLAKEARLVDAARLLEE